MLLASAPYPLQGAEIEHLRECLAAPIDWASFCILVQRHRIVPTVYRNLNAHVPQLVPTSTLAELKEQAGLNRLRVLQFVAELDRLSQLFDREGIPLCALKGPLLSQTLFGDVGLRTCRDLDLLIQYETLFRAEALLLDNGYRRKLPSIPLTPRQWQAYQQEWRHLSYFSPEQGILVELHWALAPPHVLPMGQVRTLFNRATPYPKINANLLILSKEDLPVYLLIHGSLHSWVRLKWLVDLVGWMRKAAPPDWESLSWKMNELGLQRALAQGMLLAENLFPGTVPEPMQVLPEADPAAQDLASYSLKAILNSRYTGMEAGGFERFRVLLYRAKLKKDLRYKWAAVSKAWIIHYDWQDLPLPDALYPLYWLLRPFLWFRRYYLRRH